MSTQKVARAAIDFDPDLDDAFRVHVVKARVLLPPELREQLEPAVAEFVREAQIAYRKNGGGSSSLPAKLRRNGARQTRKSTDSPRHWLELAAVQTGQRTALKAIVKEVRRVSPATARQLGW